MEAPDHTPLIISGSSHPDLAGKIAQASGWPLAHITLKRFACSEVYVRLNENVRNRDVVIVQSPHTDIDAHLWELMAIVDAASSASARTITALIPCLPYSRQDKTGSSRESITTRLLAKVLEASGVNHIVTMDLHTGQLQGVFRIPCDHLTAQQLLLRRLRDHGVGGNKWVVAAPDAGRVKLARKYATLLGCELVILSKERPSHNEAHILRVIGSEHVRERNLLLIDDMIDTAGTLCAAATVLLEHGAQGVYAACTHPIFSDPAAERLSIESCPIEGIWVCDTLPTPDIPLLEVIPTADLWASALKCIHDGDSLSALFDGHNQEF